MFSLLPSSHLQKIGISSLIFLSGMGSVFAAPATPPGETNGGKFSQYFQNIADTDCTGGNVLMGFNNTPGNSYLLKECMSIGPIIGAFFSTQPTAPAGTAITGFNPTTGAPIFGNASQWVGNVPGNIYYTGGNVGIGTNIIGNKDKLRIETPESFWGTVFYRNGGIIGGIHTNSAMLTLQNMSGAQIYMSGANIGIGTTKPLTKLQVAGEVTSTNANAFRMVQGNYGTFWRNDGSNAYLLSTNSGSQYGSWNGFRPFIYNFASGTVFLANTITALNSGNVGIGSTNPLTKLQVAGEVTSTNANAFRMVQGNYGTFWRNNGTDLYLFSTDPGIQYGTYNTFRPFRYNFASGTVFLANSAITALSTGNVGIGTSTPNTKLDVNGNINLNGQIMGGFGASAAGGALDWNNPTNARSGNGYTLLTANALNGPIPSSGAYYHPFSFEYNSKNGAGNMTQFAIPYNSSSLNAGMYIRTRYSNSWTNWSRIISENTSGNVGIGTTSPAVKLDVNGDINANGRIKALGSSIFAQNDNTSTKYDKAAIQIREAQYGGNNTFLPPRISFHWGSTYATQIGLDSTGRITILNGNGNDYANLIAKTIYSSNYYYTSDKRLKKDIVPIISPLEKIKALSGYTFSWKDTGVKSVGLIAQEVEKVFPELVGETQTASGMTIKTVQYGNLVAPLIESVKELSHLHDQDQKKIEDLQSEVEQMKKDIEFLRSQIKK